MLKQKAPALSAGAFCGISGFLTDCLRADSAQMKRIQELPCLRHDPPVSTGRQTINQRIDGTEYR